MNAPGLLAFVPRTKHDLTIHSALGEAFFFWHAAPGFYDLVAAWVRHTVEK